MTINIDKLWNDKQQKIHYQQMMMGDDERHWVESD